METPVMQDAERIGHSRAVVRLTFELTGRLRAHLERVAATMDLSQMQAKALFMTSEPLPMRNLADALHCDASNVTGIVDRLEERGLMTRVVDPDDRRRRNLVVTDEGRAVTEAMRELVVDGHPLLGLDDTDLVTLRRILEQLHPGGSGCASESGVTDDEVSETR